MLEAMLQSRRMNAKPASLSITPSGDSDVYKWLAGCELLVGKLGEGVELLFLVELKADHFLENDMNRPLKPLLRLAT